MLSSISVIAEKVDYFPDKIMREFYEEWFGQFLSAMEEPSLYPLAEDDSKEIYRFTLLETWGRPVSVRIEITNQLASVTTVKLTGSGGYEPGEIKFKETVLLNATQSTDLLKRINALNFTSIPTVDKTFGCDGARWIFEGVKNGKYHVINRWCPDAYDTEERGLVEFVSVCNHLLKYVKKDSNQMLQPTVKTPVESGSEQGTAAEL